jgi:hypothetical protein
VLVLWLLVLVGAAVLLVKSRQRDLGRRGWPWFGAWALAGALFVFSSLTGSVIGVVLFPPGAFALFWLAVNAPFGRELAGFPLGIGVVLPVMLLV